MSRSLWMRRAGAALIATVSVGALSAAPARAAAHETGEANLFDGAGFVFWAAKNQVNRVTITQSGSVITVDDRVAVKPGEGCVQVAGDRTRVRCTFTVDLSQASMLVALENRNDYVINKTAIYLNVNGHAGNDTIIGGPAVEELNGGTGRDTIKGGAGADWLRGGDGNDTIVGGKGRDRIEGGRGRDRCDVSSSDTVKTCEILR